MIDYIGSLCSGVGGLDRALSAHFGRLPIGWHCENADGPAEVLKVRLPAPNFGDITVIDWADLPRPRVLAMGVPCQPTSNAGRRLGDMDPRWLWPYARTAVAQLSPEWVGFENVAGLVSYDGGRLWRGILSDLVKLGYRVAWGIFGACLAPVSGCHHRHRVFALARKGLTSAPAEDIRWSGKACGVPSRRVQPGSPVEARDGEGRGEGSADYWSRQGTKGAPLGAQLGILFPSPRAIDAERGPASIARGDGRAQGVDLGTALLAFERYQWAVERWSDVHGAPPAPTESGPRDGVRIAAPFPEWMMGYASGYATDILPRKEALKAIGNAVFPRQAYYAFGELAKLI